MSIIYTFTDGQIVQKSRRGSHTLFAKDAIDWWRYDETQALVVVQLKDSRKLLIKDTAGHLRECLRSATGQNG